ncbi:MAG TPA: hypothetical protein VMC41_04365 [Candidatus Nanoarchaeia archaeon]|nr:hypothetical protein [Candidatus Nanoarchaeia archaeon]
MFFWKKKFIIRGALFFLFLFSASSVLAAEPLVDQGALKNMGSQEKAFVAASGLSPNASIASIVSVIIEVALGLLAIIFVVLLVIAGFNWMTAGGNEEKIDKAKQTITRAIIGLAIIIAAYSITYFVFNAINSATTVSGGPL